MRHYSNHITKIRTLNVERLTAFDGSLTMFWKLMQAPCESHPKMSSSRLPQLAVNAERVVGSELHTYLHTRSEDANQVTRLLLGTFSTKCLDCTYPVLLEHFSPDLLHCVMIPSNRNVSRHIPNSLRRISGVVVGRGSFHRVEHGRPAVTTANIPPNNTAVRGGMLTPTVGNPAQIWQRSYVSESSGMSGSV